MDPTAPIPLFKIITDGGPYAVALVVCFFWYREAKRADRLEEKLLNQLPALTAAMNRMRWLIQGRRGPEDDEESGR